MTSFKCWFPLFILGVAFLGSVLATRAEEPQLVQTIPLDGVEGRIDHMSMDVKGGRLFVAALGNNTVQIVDFSEGRGFSVSTGAL